MARNDTLGPKWGWILLLIVILTGCGPGYRIHRADGIETLYHVSANGDKRIVYVVNDDGDLTIHDANDPLIQEFLAANQSDDAPIIISDPTLVHPPNQDTGIDTRRLMRIGRIKAAKKRRSSDPIHVMVHDPESGPAITRRIGTAEKTKLQIRDLVTRAMSADEIIQLTPQGADVEVHLKIYLKETAALNIKTYKLVAVQAFHFEALVRSNYLSENRQTIKGLGYWMEYREVIKDTVQRINQYIVDEIGATIPKNRRPFLPPIPPEA